MTRRAAALCAMALLGACGGSGNNTNPLNTSVTVFAAASLKPPFDRIAQQMHVKATFEYAGTQTLVTQLEQGAAADVFASADTAHMTSMVSAGLIAGTPKVFAHNRLEIAVARGNPKRIHSLADLARPGLVVVLADPSVPAGMYAAQALAMAHVTVKPASLELEVTAVLNKVVIGDADAGIVYHSDVVTSGKVDGIAIPDDQNVIADYPIAPLKAAPNSAGANQFISFVLSSQGQAILTDAGFSPA